MNATQEAVPLTAPALGSTLAPPTRQAGVLRRFCMGVFTVWYRDFKRLLRDRVQLLSALGQPLLYLFVFGAGLAPSMSGLGPGVDFRHFMFPGILGMTILFTSIFSGMSIIWDREFGFLKEVMVAPVPRAAVTLGKVAGGATVGVTQGVIVLLLAPFIGLKLGVVQVLSLLGLMILLALVMTSLGVLFAVRQRSMQGFQVITQFLLMPMFFLSGAFFPLGNIPLWLEVLGRVNPVTYAVDPLRQVVLQRHVDPAVLDALSLHSVGIDVLVLIGFGAAFLVPAIWLFGRKQ